MKKDTNHHSGAYKHVVPTELTLTPRLGAWEQEGITPVRGKP